MGRLRAFVQIAALCAFAFTAACAGGGSGGGTHGLLATVPTATPAPAQSADVALTTDGPAAVAVPAVAGYAATLTFGPAFFNEGVTSAIVTGSVTTPAAAATPSSTATITLAHALSLAPPNVLFYLTIDTDATMGFAGIPAIAIALPSNAAPATQYRLAAIVPPAFFAEGSGPWTMWAGPQAAIKGTVTFSSDVSDLVLNPGEPIVFALYSGAALN